MSNAGKRSGRCLCGAVTIEARSASSGVGACHCRTCRRWGGGPFLEIDCGSDVKFGGEGHIRVFDSSAWAERGFCSTCGSHLFYRIEETRQHMVPVGLFDDDEGLKFETQVFIDEQPPYYAFSNETEKMTGAELFAKFAPSS